MNIVSPCTATDFWDSHQDDRIVYENSHGYDMLSVICDFSLRHPDVFRPAVKLHGAGFTSLTGCEPSKRAQTWAQEIREYYVCRYSQNAIMGKPLSEFQKDLIQALSKQSAQVTLSEFKVLISVVDFHKEDTQWDAIMDSHLSMPQEQCEALIKAQDDHKTQGVQLTPFATMNTHRVGQHYKRKTQCYVITGTRHVATLSYPGAQHPVYDLLTEMKSITVTGKFRIVHRSHHNQPFIVLDMGQAARVLGFETT